jgi:hypothetical protein|tara:strand:+ start:433 stop:546 length:114 start_codon:yes stop_codon:yes gene_type:complete
MLYGAFGHGRNSMLFWFLVLVFVAIGIGAIVAGIEQL